MKEQFRCFTFFMLMGLTFPLTATAQVVSIPDSNLRAAIERRLGKASGDPITTSDMAALRSLTARESNISDLTGLEHAINLTSLDLGRNSISDITSLSGLTKLTWLYLLGNSISNITSLSELINLTVLYLGRNLISDISTVSDLTNLRTLHLGYNSISDLTSLSGLINLNVLYFQDNLISDISAVSDLTNLRTLGIWNNNISDISAVSDLTDLTKLYFGGNSVSDMSVVSGLANLTILSLNNNSVSDISAVSGLTSLSTLSIWNNNISDISAVSGLTNLAYLELPGNSVSDISAVSDLTNLTSLYLANNSISDISAVSGLVNLTFLGVGGNSVSDISVVSGLTNLRSLSLGNNPVSDISVVSGLTNLKALHLQDNSVSDISAVSGLTNLTHLNLTNNSVSDISPLVENTGLASSDKVYIRGNLLSYLSIHTHIPILQSRRVTVYFDDRTPTRLVKISGDNQKEAAFAPLLHPFVIEVRDGGGQPFAGVSVVFTVTEGGGTLSITHTTTGAHGRAESTLTLGPNLGTNTVSVSAPEIERVETFNAISDTLPTEYRLSIPAGISLIYVPLKVRAVDEAAQTIESIGDLYDALGGASTVNFLITYDSSIQEWLGYFVPSDKGTLADRRLTDDMGIIAGMRAASSVRFRGDPLGTDKSSTITLKDIEVGDTTPVLGLRGSIVDEGTGLNNVGFRITVKNLSTHSIVSAVTTPDEVDYRSTVVDIETGRAATIGDILEISAQSPNPFIGVKPLQYTVTAEDVRRGLIQLPALVAYEIPAETKLLANYPNPFNPETWIPYRLAEDTFVTLTIYDRNGQVVRTLEVGHQIAAVYENRSKAIYWDGRNEIGEQVTSDVYFYHLSAGDYSATRKMVILK